MNNLLISCETESPEQNEGVMQAIRSLGNCVKINESFWYVRSAKSAADALTIVSKAYGSDNTVCVVDATNEVIALDTAASLEAMGIIRYNWNKKSVGRECVL